ncbi:MAG TPA: mannonate dehydratase [Rhizomicrobium sp.]|nr:mannonate dehydratase [Rhizomicrobium sp.]
MTVTRRAFVHATSALIMSQQASPTLPAAAATSSARRPVLMKLGTQEPTSEENFQRFQRYGIRNVCGWYKIQEPGRTYPSVDELAAVTELGAKYGISIDMTDTDIGRGADSAIMRGGPERDREIEAFQKTIENCAAAKIPALKYYLSILPILRLNRVPGRGGSYYYRWNAAALAAPGGDQLLSARDAAEIAKIRQVYGHFDADLFWERITYFLERVVPVANQYKIKLAQHPHDPGLPPAGIAGIPNVLGTVEGLKRFVAIQESPYHGLNFCQGTICENLDNPRRDLPAVIRYFGERKKIFNVHFRNIKGHRDDFVAECFPDDGNIDLGAAVRAYRDTGYDGMLMPDHIPAIDSRNRSAEAVTSIQEQSFAFAYGYIRALIQEAQKS